MERLKSNEGILQDKTILEKIVRQIHGSAEIDGVQSFRSGALNLNIELKIRNPATTFNLRVFFGQDAETRARRENTAYALISRNTDIPTPQVLIADYSKSMMGSVFSLQTRIPGISLDGTYDSLADREKEQVADQIGRVLGQLHLLRVANFGDLNAGEASTREETWRDHVATFSIRNLQRALEAGKIDKDLYDKVLNHFNYWDWLIPKQISASLLHRDVHLGNIMVLQDSAGNFYLSGILDFEYAFAGHSEYDLAMLYLDVFNRYPIMKSPLLRGYSEVNKLSDLFELRVNKVYELAKITEFLDFCTRYCLPQEEFAIHIKDIERVVN